MYKLTVPVAIAVFMLIYSMSYPVIAKDDVSSQVRTPASTEKNLRERVQSLGYLLEDVQGNYNPEYVEIHPMCSPEEKAPACTTLVIFYVASTLGNASMEYLALFEPVDAGKIFLTLPKVVQSNIHFHSWTLLSVIPIGFAVSPPYSFQGAKFANDEIVLYGRGYGPHDPECCPTNKITVKFRIVNGVLVPVNSDFFKDLYK